VQPKSLPLGTSKKSTRSRLLAQFDRGAAWADKNDSEKAELSSFQKRNDLFKTRQRNGHFGTDKAAEDYAFWRGAAAFFEAKQANSERRAERSLSDTQKVAQHSDDILIALDSNDPVSAEAVDTYGIKLPEGYVRQGELYVFQPTVTTAPVPKGKVPLYQVRASQGKPVTDADEAPTGWKLNEYTDAIELVSEDATKFVVFPIADSKSYADKLRALMKAEDWAIDNPVRTQSEAAPMEANYGGGRVEDVQPPKVRFTHTTKTMPGKGQKSGYYPGTYAYEKESGVIPPMEGKRFTGELLETEIYTLTNPDGLKKEASEAGFGYHSGNGNAEVKYLKSKGFKAIRRGSTGGVEIIVFDAPDANFQPTVTTATETPIDAANVDGGSQGVQSEPAEGSIPAVTEDTVSISDIPSTGETRGAEDEPFGKLPTEEVETDLSRRTKQAEEEEAREKIEAPKRRAEAIQTFVSEGAVVQTRKRVVGRAKAREGGGDVTRTEHFLVHPDRREIPLSASEAKKVSTAAPRSPAENLVSFTAANGQKLVGEVQSVTGNKATVAYQWNGKTKTQVVPVSQLGSPVASVATPPKYQYNQEQNTRKLGKHFPTALGVHANHDFRKSFASMAKDTALGQDYQMIAKLLSNMPEFKNMDLHLVADENIDYAGEYSWNRGKPSIAINLRLIARGQVDALGSILHEALHHVTLAKVRNPQGAFENEVVSKLDLIRESVREYAESRGYAEALEYELGSTEEFITALFTRPDFQALIASIPDSAAPAVAVGKFRSLLSEIFRLIAELVHGKPVLRGSALEQAMTTSLALFNTPFRAIETGGLEALNAARSPGKGIKALFPQTGDKAAKPINLSAAYQKAATGKSSQWVTIKEVYEQAKADDPVAHARGVHAVRPAAERRWRRDDLSRGERVHRRGGTALRHRQRWRGDDRARIIQPNLCSTHRHTAKNRRL
jgi:hypothetical protein